MGKTKKQSFCNYLILRTKERKKKALPYSASLIFAPCRTCIVYFFITFAKSKKQHYPPSTTTAHQFKSHIKSIVT